MLALILCAFLAPAPVPSPSPQGPSEAGAVAFAQACLDATADAVVLNVAAHPDDEAARTMVQLRHQYGVRTVTLYTTCGGGGQNAVGREIGGRLAAIRVRETLAAAAHTGTRVRWLGFDDFGYSKSMEESLAVWGGDELLRRMAAAIDRIEPDLVFTNHDTERGHGHHRASAWALERIALEFEARRGRVLPLYQRVFQGGDDTTASFDPFDVDPARGVTFARQAHDGWLEHRTQGPWGPHNPVRVRTERWREVVRDGEPSAVPPVRRLPSLFDEPAFVAAARALPLEPDALRADLDAFLSDRSRHEHVAAARALIPVLRDVEARLRGEDGDDASALRRLGRRIEALERVVTIGSGITIETFLDNDHLPPGGEGVLRVAVRGPEVANLKIRCGSAVLVADAADASSAADASARAADGAGRRGRGGRGGRAARGDGANGAARLLETPGVAEIPPELGGDGERVPALPPGWHELALRVLEGAADDDPSVALTGVRTLDVETEFELDGLLLHTTSPVEVTVAPALQMSFDRDVVMVPRGEWQRVLSLRVTYNGDGPMSGRLRFRAPAGLEVEALPATVQLADSQRDLRVLCRLRGAAGVSKDRFLLTAILAGADPARVEVQPADVEVVGGLKVGLVRGPDDTMARFFEDLDVPFEDLDETQLAVADLRAFSTLVLDIRAYHHRPDLANHQERLLGFCRAGGRVVVFYHKPREWNAGPGKPLLAPFALRVGNARVSEETAAVTLLEPEHRLWHYPHTITAADFDGWVQERGLNFPSSWDDAWVPLTSMHDAGEEPLMGGLLYTRYGRGDFVYCSLALYRQIRDGHVGAARVLLNLLSR